MFDAETWEVFFDFIESFGMDWWQALIFITVILFTWAVGKFWRNVLAWIGKKLGGVSPETLQYRMFWGLVSDALNIKMKNELRRSFKENGFHETSGNDFSAYVKNQSKALMSMLRDHIINLYPPTNNKLIVSMEDVLDYLDKKEPEIEDSFFEIYIEAKRLRKHEIDKKADIETKFAEEINTFVEKDHDDCSSCMLILFGKREIAENKKEQIKTLKAQMNFVEQKFTEIQSDLLSFYSEKINDKNK